MRFSIYRIVRFAAFGAIISVSHLSAQESDVEKQANEVPLSSEQRAWQATKAIGTIGGYRKFLEDFPATTLLTKRAAELVHVDRELKKAYIRLVQLYPTALNGWDGEISTVVIGTVKISALKEETVSAWGYLLSSQEYHPLSKRKILLPIGFSINTDVKGDGYEGKKLLNKVPLPSDWTSSVAPEPDRKGHWVSDDGMSLHTVLVDGGLGSLQFYKKGTPSVVVPIKQLDRRLADRIISTIVRTQTEFTGRSPKVDTGFMSFPKGFATMVPMSLDVAFWLRDLKMEKAVFNGVEYWSLTTYPPKK